LTYLGGVFYTVNLLPEFWQMLSRFNPILYMINSMRYSVIGISDVSIQYALMMIVIFFIILFSAAVFLLKRGIGIRQ
jgi:ABC-2 type transport system permease protein